MAVMSGLLWSVSPCCGSLRFALLLPLLQAVALLLPSLQAFLMVGTLLLPSLQAFLMVAVLCLMLALSTLWALAVGVAPAGNVLHPQQACFASTPFTA